MSHAELGLRSPLPKQASRYNYFINTNQPVSKEDLDKAKRWKSCDCVNRNMKCKPIHDANRRTLTVTQRCSINGCVECGNTLFHCLKDVGFHEHLRLNEEGKVVSNVCIPKYHFIACLTGVVVEKEMPGLFVDVRMRNVSMCEASEAQFHFLDDSQLTVRRMFSKAKRGNAFLKSGYIWASTLITAGEPIILSNP